MANKVKQQEGYQVKQVLAEKAAELNAFGWNKVKNSTRTIKKKTYVNIRRKMGLAKVNELKPLENKYNKWAKKKIKKNPIGGIFAFLFMVIFLAVGVVGLYLGLNDDMLSGKAYEKSIAAYNAAIEAGLIEAADLDLDEIKACELNDDDVVEVNDGYNAFIKKYVAYSFGGFVNNFTYLDEEEETVALKDDADKVNEFGTKYIAQLSALGYADEDAELDFDASIEETDDGYAVKAGALDMINGIFDGMIRPMIQGFGIGYAPFVAGFGILFLAGAGCFVLFIIMLIVFIRICKAKSRIAKRDEIIAECIKEAGEIVYGAKCKNRDLMTKTERKINDYQKMVVRAIRQANEDDDDDE